MEEIVKGFFELCQANKEVGLAVAVSLVVGYFLTKQWLKQMKWREEWIERLHVALINNEKFMRDVKDTLVNVQKTVAELDTDAHDVFNHIETDRVVEDRVAAELERRSHGRRTG